MHCAKLFHEIVPKFRPALLEQSERTESSCAFDQGNLLGLG